MHRELWTSSFSAFGLPELRAPARPPRAAGARAGMDDLTEKAF